MAKLTVAIPVYNEARFISETLRSALDQELDEVVVVASDNGSTDGSAALIRVCERDPRLVPRYRGQNDGSIVNSLGMLYTASTPYFAFLGGHDLVSKGLYRKAVEFLEKNEDYSICFGRERYIDESGTDVRNPFPRRGVAPDYEKVDGERRVLEDLASTTSYFAFYGVFRTRALLDHEFRHVSGPDQLVFRHLLKKGKARLIEDETFYARCLPHAQRRPNEGFDVRKHDYIALTVADFEWAMRGLAPGVERERYLERCIAGVSRRVFGILADSDLADASVSDHWMFWANFIKDPVLKSEVVAPRLNRVVWEADDLSVELDRRRSRSIVVYGSGLKGRVMFRLFARAGGTPTAFCQTVVEPKSIHSFGVPILAPQDIPKGSWVVVAADFSDEIIATLRSLGRGDLEVSVVW